MYGLFFFSIMLYFSLQIIRFWRETAPPFTKPLPRLVQLITTLSGITLLILAVLGLGRVYADAIKQNFSLSSGLLSLITLPVALLTLWPGAWAGLRASVQRQGLVIISFSLLLLWGIGPTLKMELLGLVATVLYLSLSLGWRAWQRSVSNNSQEDEQVRPKEQQAAVRLAQFDTLFFVLVALAAFITLFTENLYVRDIYTNRFNTMFKFWYQLWMLYGLAAVYATWRILSWRSSLKTTTSQDLAALFVATSDHNTPRPVPALPLPAKAKWRWGWAAGLVFLAFVACACPVLGYWQATDHYRNRQGLDGEAWYAQEYPTEYPAMKWLRDLARDDPDKRGVVLEVNGMNYSWYDRISTYTGLPTIVGWPFHELQWRASLDDSIIWEAWLDMDRIYATTDSAKALEMLRRHNVRYVFVGQIENGTRTGRDNANKAKEYSAEALAKFGTFMKTIYADPPNNIYIYAFY